MYTFFIKKCSYGTEGDWLWHEKGMYDLITATGMFAQSACCFLIRARSCKKTQQDSPCYIIQMCTLIRNCWDLPDKPGIFETPPGGRIRVIFIPNPLFTCYVVYKKHQHPSVIPYHDPIPGDLVVQFYRLRNKSMTECGHFPSNGFQWKTYIELTFYPSGQSKKVKRMWIFTST